MKKKLARNEQLVKLENYTVGLPYAVFGSQEFRDKDTGKFLSMVTWARYLTTEEAGRYE